MDLMVDAAFPDVSPARLARQIRQDVWRALQRVRGFSPVIELIEGADGVQARIGGQVDGRFPRAHCEEAIREVIDANRVRWIRWAAR